MIKSLSDPKLKGGNVVVEIKDEEYQQGVQALKFSVVGKLSLQRGDSPPT